MIWLTHRHRPAELRNCSRRNRSERSRSHIGFRRRDSFFCGACAFGSLRPTLPLSARRAFLLAETLDRKLFGFCDGAATLIMNDAHGSAVPGSPWTRGLRGCSRPLRAAARGPWPDHVEARSGLVARLGAARCAGPDSESSAAFRLGPTDGRFPLSFPGSGRNRPGPVWGGKEAGPTPWSAVTVWQRFQ